MSDEAVFTCTVCTIQVAVGPYHDDIDPATYRCIECRQAVSDSRGVELADVIARARKRQKEAV